MGTTRFDHERLDAYRVATEALALGVLIARRVARVDGFLRDQLLRALTSVCFNMAEGSGEFSPGDKARFFRMARRSASEAAAITDALRLLDYVSPDQAEELKTLLSRVTWLRRKRKRARKRKRGGCDRRSGVSAGGLRLRLRAPLALAARPSALRR
jgi:four helix bundle protein